MHLHPPQCFKPMPHTVQRFQLLHITEYFTCHRDYASTRVYQIQPVRCYIESPVSEVLRTLGKNLLGYSGAKRLRTVSVYEVGQSELVNKLTKSWVNHMSSKILLQVIFILCFTLPYVCFDSCLASALVLLLVVPWLW